MRLEVVHPQHVVALWPEVEGFLEAAFEHSAGEYTVEQLRVFLVEGRQTLIVLVDETGIHGAVAIATETYPNATVAFVTAVGGKAIACRENFEQLFAWCRERGYTRIRGAAYESVARLWRRFGAQEIYRTVEITL